MATKMILLPRTLVSGKLHEMFFLIFAATGGFVYCSALTELINAETLSYKGFPDVYW